MNEKLFEKFNEIEDKLYVINNLYMTMFDAIKNCHNENKEAYHLLELGEIIDKKFQELIDNFEYLEQKLTNI